MWGVWGVWMSKAQAPELKKLMGRRLSVKLNAERRVSGLLRGYDHFTNLVLEEAVEHRAAEKGGDKVIGEIMVRGNSIVSLAVTS